MTHTVRLDGKAESSPQEAALTGPQDNEHETMRCAREALGNEQVAVWAGKVTDTPGKGRGVIPHRVLAAHWVQFARIIYPADKRRLLFSIPAANGSCLWLWPICDDAESMDIILQSAPAMLPKVLKQVLATSYSFWLKANADGTDLLLVGGASTAGEQFLGKFEVAGSVYLTKQH